jgi:hypothetical protein
MTPGLALQGAINTTLRAATAVTALVGTRIYDRVPQGVAFPFIQLGDVQGIDDGHDCGDAAEEVFLDVHVWSRAVGKVEAQTITASVKAALHKHPPALATGWRCVELMVRDTRTVTDTDVNTTHVVMNVRALIDPVS